MKPILYAGDEIDFTSNGLGRLADATRCIVTEERNGVYLCEFDIPVTSPMYGLIQEGRYVGAIHDDRHDIQPFEIYGRSAPIGGLVTFYGHHLSYKLRNVILKPFTASSCAEALSLMQTQTYNQNPFTFWTDKSVSAVFKNIVPASCRSMLAGQEGSILDVYGTGEYEFDKWAVKLHLHRGNDNGVTIRYGVNLTDIEQETDISASYSAVAPYWKSEDGATVVTLPEGYVVSPTAPVQLYPWTTDTGEYMTNQDGEILELAVKQTTIVPLDLSGEFEEAPTEAQLRALAMEKLVSGEPWLPKETITISFMDMTHTEDYAAVAALQRVSLCDRVSVYCAPLGIGAVSMQVVRTVYNVLAEKYDELELGAPRATFADTIMTEVNKQTGEFVTGSALESTVDHATQLIIGGLGGYVVFNMNANGQPEELLIMDTPDTKTAVNVWRFNKNGLGHSHNGYNGPFDDVALTADGQINADMITVGKLMANMIMGGILTLGGLENVNGVLQIKDANGNIIGSWDSDGISVSKGTISGPSIILGGANNASGSITVRNAAGQTIGTWDNTGINILSGTFATTSTSGGVSYTIEMAGGAIVFKRNGATFGRLYPLTSTFMLEGTTGMNIRLQTHNATGTGSGIGLNTDGTIDMYGDISLTGDLNIVGDITVDNYDGYTGNVATAYGELNIHNGIIYDYTPDV